MNERTGAVLLIGAVIAGAIALAKVSRAQPPPDGPPPEELDSHINWTVLPPDEVPIGSRVEWEATVTNITDTYMRYTFDGGYYTPDGEYIGLFGGFSKDLNPGESWSQSSVAHLNEYGTYVLMMKSNGVEIRDTVTVV